MTPAERVIAVIEHRKPDRMPVYGWVSANLSTPITAAFGSVAGFEDHYEFDLAHLFGGPAPYPEAVMRDLHATAGGIIEPRHLLDMSLPDPDNMADYDNIRKGIEHHKNNRGRFVYVQTPGLFECLNGPFGIENHLAYLALFEEELAEIYHRQAEWNRRFAMNCLDLGVDMIHVSDDWGAQNGLLFSPATWRKLIRPGHRIMCDAVRARNGYLSLHSDGNIRGILDDIADLGYMVIHPFQESAGMSFADYKRGYADKFVIMGGLDVQTTIGFGNYTRLEHEIRRVTGMFADGGLIFCTSHFVQEHCSMDELKFAYDLVYDLIRDGR